MNSVYAKLLALTYFGRLEGDGPRFGAANAALLRRGYDAAPDQLLRGVLGTGLGGPALVADAAALVSRRVAEYECSAAAAR